ncbi:MAG: hypothetical protein IT174_16660 [Acidobacteria bacterium]|nr:hypothetical protein [Acidobacteriota bacterium]
MKSILFTIILAMPIFSFAQTPPIEPGVSLELAKWRAAHYSDVRYKLNLTLEKMSPVLKGTIEIRVKLSEPPASAGGQPLGSGTETRPVGGVPPIILDWRKLKGHEEKSTISNVFVNGRAVKNPVATAPGSDTEHLIFSDGVVAGENVLKLDFTSPILTSGSAITRYVDKEDGSEYLYSLFVPSDASTAFPVFDQPDLKARFELIGLLPDGWTIVSNTAGGRYGTNDCPTVFPDRPPICLQTFRFDETKPISTYVFAFAAGPWEKMSEPPAVAGGLTSQPLTSSKSKTSGLVASNTQLQPPATAGGSDIYVRKSQAAKFKPHAAEVFRLNREAVKFFEQYFDYKFPFPKYDLVLIPEFPFGGMEHAGATFLRESSIIFPQEPTKNDYISRATLIFHETAHQWFGDTVTMRWFDDLWLKEGFATFMAYKALEKIMPEMNAWKVFYERVKQSAYQTDSTKGTTSIYQPIANLSAAKSAYGAIVYSKAPAFLRQAEFYLGEDKFQDGVRKFLRKHEYGNATWQDLVYSLAGYRNSHVQEFARPFVTEPGVPIIRFNRDTPAHASCENKAGVHLSSRSDAIGYTYSDNFKPYGDWGMDVNVLLRHVDEEAVGKQRIRAGNGYLMLFPRLRDENGCPKGKFETPALIFPNYGDYGYGIFLLDEKSRDYVLKNIQNEKDPFLRAMMWGALWDSVREGELDPRVFVDLVVKVLQKPAREQGRNQEVDSHALTNVRASALDDESTVALLLNRVGTAMNYYLSEPPALAGGFLAPRREKNPPANAGGTDLRSRVEDMLIERMQNAPTLGQRITFYRAFLSIAASENGRRVLKEMLKSEPPAVAGGLTSKSATTSSNSHVSNLQPPATAGGSDLPLKAKDKFDIVTRLLILADPDAPKLLAELEKTETSDDAKRYAYAAKAGIPTAGNKAKYWNDFINNKQISESWIEAAMGPWNSIRHSELTLPYLEKALQELPNHKRSRKIFFVNGWLGAFIGGQRSEEALAVVNKFFADNPNLDNDLRLKVLENVDLIERAVKIRSKFKSQ